MQTPPSLSETILLHLHRLPVPILDGFGAVLYGRVLCIAVRRNLFEVLAAGPLDGATLARATGFGAVATELLCEAFVVGGYLQRRGARYALSATARHWLLKRSPRSMAGFLAYVETLHSRWGELETALDHDGPVRPYYSGFSEADWRTYVLGMHDLARITLPYLGRALRIGRRTPAVLDLGGSHGLYAVAVCRSSPDVRATIVDFPEALRHTAGMLREEGMMNRCTLLPGDLRTMELPGGQGLILLFNIIHGMTADENAALLRRCIGALDTGGTILLLDQLAERKHGTLIARMIPVLVGLNLLSEAGGRSYRVADIVRWCGPDADVAATPLRLPGVTLVRITRVRGGR